MSEKRKKNVLFVPSLKKGNGTGHFRRCVSFCARPEINGRIYIPRQDSPQDYTLHELLSAMPGFSDELTVRTMEDEWDFVILDQRNSSKSLLSTLPSSSAIIALDEGSPDSSMDYLIDLLPAASKRNVNLYEPLLGLDPEIPSKRAGRNIDGPLRVLVTFGGEDAKHLTELVLEKLADIVQSADKRPGIAPFEVTAVQGPLFGRNLPGNLARVIKNPDKLSHLLCSYDLVICSFGITSFESMKAGVPVLHVNPGPYHTKLSKASGITVAGTGKVSALQLEKGMEKALSDKPESISPSISANGFSGFLSELTLSHMKCPGCGSEHRRCLERFPQRTFFYCNECSLVYQNRALPHGIEYGEAYFFDEYKNQYGKTYLQDFSHIKDMGLGRMAIVEAVSGGKGKGEEKTLLDIGCAFGPFLEAARVSGYLPVGLDVSQEAVDYVIESLGIEGHCSAFPAINAKGMESRVFDTVSMWYVIEHFEHIAPVLEKVSSLNAAKGIFCFSTPNYRGISSRHSRRTFLQNSPADHWTIWSAKSAKKLLEKYGYKIRRIRSTGIHPSRFPKVMRMLPAGLLTMAAGWFHLGDTFEVYAQKASKPANKNEQGN